MMRRQPGRTIRQLDFTPQLEANAWLAKLEAGEMPRHRSATSNLVSACTRGFTSPRVPSSVLNGHQIGIPCFQRVEESYCSTCLSGETSRLRVTRESPMPPSSKSNTPTAGSVLDTNSVSCQLGLLWETWIELGETSTRP